MINMKLFPAYKNPPPVKSWHVPIPKINLLDIVDDRWDLTLRKIIPEIDGINDVRKIAHNADVALDLTKLALQHLLYYQTILMLDMFFFSNIYAVMPAINDFVNNAENMQEECAGYVFTSGEKLANYYLCRLFTSLCQGRTLKEWLKLHMDDGLDVMKYVDVRRFVQFGVIKGLLKRVHKFPVSSQYLAGLVTGEIAMKDGGDSLQKYMDGCHCFDQIIVAKNLTDATIARELGKLKPPGDVHILYR
jgi:nitrogen permease regulator 2-like protein